MAVKQVVVFCLSWGIIFIISLYAVAMLVLATSQFVSPLFGIDGSNDTYFKSLLAMITYAASFGVATSGSFFAVSIMRE